jgi:L-amino acid N-acyltransferase YncA
MIDISIEKMSVDSWVDIQRIYSEGIASGNATFEKQIPDWETWDKLHRKDCRLVARINGKITGWAALSNISERYVYSGVAEVSIYVDPYYMRKGIGNKLLSSLIKESQENGIWTLQAGIFPENVSSIKLHEKHGFRIIGVREKIGKMNSRWRDVFLLERRSKSVGIE